MVLIEEMYNMIFKRKSFRRFNDQVTLSKGELEDIHIKLKSLKPLVKGIKVHYEIVPREQTTSKRGEYCLLIYSEEKEHYLQNVGYLFEQLDLYLASQNIGVCWYGMGKTEVASQGNLKFVIMMALGKALDGEFRKDYTKAKRKDTKDIWTGNLSFEVGEVVKYAPSACNTQPWRVVCEKEILSIYRSKTIKSIMPKDKVPFYNSIDLGIFLYFIELSLTHNRISFERNLISANSDAEPILTAIYRMERE